MDSTSSPSQCADPRASQVLSLVMGAGAVAAGITTAEAIADGDVEAYRRWIAAGCHGEMDYLARYDDVRSHPALLLDGAKSIIVAAFPYSSVSPAAPRAPQIARYALGRDYHTVLRERLQPVVEFLHQCGAAARVCVDTAPVRERLLAVRAGVGFIGRNGLLIVPRRGSYVLLAEIVTTLPLAPSAPCTLGCGDCGRCVKACPTGALDNRCIDCRRCLSYLTIEYRGERLPEGISPGRRLFGCDTCQQVCPHNCAAAAVAPLPEFMPLERWRDLDAEMLRSLTPSAWRRLTADSALSRARLPMILRNLSAIESEGVADGQMEGQ